MWVFFKKSTYIKNPKTIFSGFNTIGDDSWDKKGKITN